LCGLEMRTRCLLWDYLAHARWAPATYRDLYVLLRVRPYHVLQALSQQYIEHAHATEREKA